MKYIPVWFPGAGFKRTAQTWKKNLEQVVDKPYAFVQQRMSGKFEPSYLANLLKASPQMGPEEEMVAKWTAGSLYTGGADTVGHSSARNATGQLIMVRRFVLLKPFSWP